jgi:hypothetical protein
MGSCMRFLSPMSVYVCLVWQSGDETCRLPSPESSWFPRFPRCPLLRISLAKHIWPSASPPGIIDVAASSSDGPAVARRDTQPAIAVLHEYRAEPSHLLVQTRDRLLHPIIVDGEALHFGLEFGQPRLLPLPTFESGCTDASARCRVRDETLDTAGRIRSGARAHLACSARGNSSSSPPPSRAFLQSTASCPRRHRCPSYLQDSCSPQFLCLS